MSRAVVEESTQFPDINEIRNFQNYIHFHSSLSETRLFFLFREKKLEGIVTQRIALCIL